MSARAMDASGTEAQPHGRSGDASPAGGLLVHSSVNGHAQSVVFIVGGNTGRQPRAR